MPSSLTGSVGMISNQKHRYHCDKVRNCINKSNNCKAPSRESTYDGRQPHFTATIAYTQQEIYQTKNPNSLIGWG